MGWKGTMRTMAAAARAAERNAVRAEREHTKQQAKLNKAAAIEEVAFEVKIFNSYINRITSIHKNSPTKNAWEVSPKEPKKPRKTSSKSLGAQKDLSRYKPSLFDRITGKKAHKILRLEQKLATAIKAEENEHAASNRKHSKNLKAWENSQVLSKQVAQLDPLACIEAIETSGRFKEIKDLGTHLDFSVSDAGRWDVSIKVHSDDIIPSEQKSQLQSGKLSQKKMPISKFHEIYQDYVCGAVLRAGAEFLSLIPAEQVFVCSVDDLLNTATGLIEETPILSVQIPRSTLEKINIAMVDPSDCLDNFNHRMKFMKTKGFSRVEKL